MNYQQAYNKIIEAYFRDEIKPMHREFCFCGTLAGGEDWNKNSSYNNREYGDMESALLENISHYNCNKILYDETPNSEYEKQLFAGMSAALDVLKQIHIERGEVIDEVPAFTLRNVPQVAETVDV